MFELLPILLGVLKWAMISLGLIITLLLINKLYEYSKRMESRGPAKEPYDMATSIIMFIIMLWGIWVFLQGAIYPEERMNISTFAAYSFHTVLPLGIFLLVIITVVTILFPWTKERKIGG